LHPLQIPDSQWDTLSVDFIVELFLSSGHDTVITVVDSVLKQAHFIPMHTIVTAEGAYKETPPFLPLNGMTVFWSYLSLFN